MQLNPASNFNYDNLTNDSYLSISEASNFLKISPASLRRLEKENHIKSFRLSNGYRVFRYEDLLELKMNYQDSKLALEDIEFFGSKGTLKQEALGTPNQLALSKIINARNLAKLQPVFALFILAGFLGLLLAFKSKPQSSTLDLTKADKESVLAEAVSNKQSSSSGYLNSSYNNTEVIANLVLDQLKGAIYPIGGDNKSVGTDENPFRSIFAKKFTLDKEGNLFLEGVLDIQNNVIIDDSLKIRDHLKVEDNFRVEGNSELGSSPTNTLTINGVEYLYPSTQGLANQVLVNNGSGTLTWEDAGSGTGNLDGTGSANYVPLWTDSDTLTSSNIYQASGNIGIGTTAPEYQFHNQYLDTTSNHPGTFYRAAVSDLFLQVDNTADILSPFQGRFRSYAPNNSGQAVGIYGTSYNYSNTGNMAAAYGIWGDAGIAPNFSGSITNVHGVRGRALNEGLGTIDNAVGGFFQIGNLGTGTINDARTVYVGPSSGNEGIINNIYGLYIEDQDCAVCQNDWAIYSVGGDSYFKDRIGIGTTAPQYQLHVRTEDYTGTLGEVFKRGGISEYFNYVNNTADYLVGFQGRARNYSEDGGNTGVMMGLIGSAANYSSNTTLNDAWGVWADVSSNTEAEITRAIGFTANIRNFSTGRIEDARGLDIAIEANDGSIGTARGIVVGAAPVGDIDTSYGIYLADQTCGDCNINSWAIYSTGGKSYFAGDIGIGTTEPEEAFSVGSASEFRVNSSGNLVRINNIPYSFPSSQGGASTILTNDGSGNLTWETPGTASIGDDSLNFTEFSDSLILDADTSVETTNFALNIFSSEAASASGQQVLKLSAIHDSGTVGSGALISFNDNGGDPAAFIQSYTFGGGEAGLAFGTGYSAPETRMVINNAGRVGIGTATPLSNLSLSSVTSQSNTPGQEIGQLTFVGYQRSNPSAAILAESPGWDDQAHLIFKTSNSGSGAVNRMIITADGYVGIGTTAPSYLTDIAGITRTIDLISNNLVLPGLNTLNGIVGFGGFIDVTGSFGTNGLERIDSFGNLKNIASITGGKLDLSRGGVFTGEDAYTTGVDPLYVVIADINGDGFLDAITANTDDDTVSVLINNKDSTFNTKVDYGVGSLPAVVQADDLNGDGFIDLVTANSGASTLSVLLNDGTGAFGTYVDYTTAAATRDVEIADVNHDGKKDLIATDRTNDTISVLTNKGNGTFNPFNTFSTGDDPRGLDSADFNSDGFVDIVATNANDDNVTVFLNSGDGTFSSTAIYSAGDLPRFVEAKDLNNDKAPDIVVSNYNDNNVSVLINDGDGTFATAVNYSTGANPLAHALEDVNGDGSPDIITPNQTADTISVLINNGNGTFGSETSYDTDLSPRSVAIGDLNNDGKPDALTSNLDADTIALLINNKEQLILADTTSGNVGVGTNNPQAKLDVFGTSDDQQLIITAASGQTANILEVLDSSSNNLIKVTSDGNLAIGSTDVDSSVDLTLSNIFEFGKWNDGQDWALFQAYDRTSNEARGAWYEASIHYFANGNVGLNTQAPDARLHVVGDSYIAPEGGYTFDNNSGNEDLYVFGNFEVDGTSYANDIIPNADDTYDLGTASLRWNEVHVGPGSVVVHNDTTDTLKAVLGFSNDIAQLTTDSSTPLQLTSGANSGIYIAADGNIGIGTTNPNNALEVVGDVLFTNSVTLNGGTSYTDGAYLDLGQISHNSTNIQGLRLPQAPTLTNPEDSEGFIAWDSDDNELKVFDGSDWITIGSGSTSPGGDSLWTDGGATTYLTSGDNVGIGTTGTSFMLAVAGNIGPAIPPTVASGSQTRTAADTTGSVGQHSSIAIGGDGLPIISYYDSGNTALKVIKCGDTSCSSGNTITTIDNTEDDGQLSQIAIGTDDLPVIAYRNETNARIKIVKCGNTSCSSGNTITTYNPAYSFLKLSLLVTADNLPIVAYLGSGPDFNEHIQVIKCSNSSCTAASESAAFTDANLFTPRFAGHINADGTPGYIYGDFDDGTLGYFKCNNVSCSSGTSNNSAYSSGTLNADADVITLDSMPYLIFHASEAGGYRIKTKACTNSTCTTGTLTDVTTPGGSALITYVRGAVGADGFANILYEDDENDLLKFIKCNNLTCSSNSITTIEDRSGVTGYIFSVNVIPSEYPILSFYDVNTTDLIVFKCGNASCTGSGTSYAGGSSLGSSDNYFADINTLRLSNPNDFGSLSLFTNNSERLTITSAGKVGIGTTSPSYRLAVNETGATVAQFNRLTSDGAIISLAQDSTEEGTISVSSNTVSYNAFTGSHYAWITDPINNKIQKGELVSLTDINHYLNSNPESEIIYGIEKTNKENDSKVLGAYLSLQEPSKEPANDNPSLIMAVGNGVMWVVEGKDTNVKNVESGDYLISSDVSGHALLDPQTYQTTYVIARAAEPINWGSVDEFIVDSQGNNRKHKLISVLYESFEKKLAESTNTSGTLTLSDAVTQVQSLEVTTNLQVLGHALLSDTDIAGNLTVGIIHFDDSEGSISTVANTKLKLQTKELAGDVDLFNGKIVLTKDGNVETGGIVKARRFEGSDESRNTVTAVLGQSTYRVSQVWADKAPKAVVATPSFDTKVWITDLDQTGFTLNVAESDDQKVIYWMAIW